MYPPGAQYDSLAPYNQPDLVECPNCYEWHENNEFEECCSYSCLEQHMEDYPELYDETKI